ncbi:unnamed protein product [Durusdinium trenchii]
MCPEKSALGFELSCANLGATTGSRVRLRCGIVLLLQGDVPPMTTHQAVASAAALLRENDPVRAAKALNHAAPLTVHLMVKEHIRLLDRDARWQFQAMNFNRVCSAWAFCNLWSSTASWKLSSGA